MGEAATQIIGPALGGIGAAMGGIAGGKGAKGAAKIAAKEHKRSQKEAIKLTKEFYYGARKDVAPWRQLGEAGLRRLYKRIEQFDKGPPTFRPSETPGYQYGFREFIEKPMERSALARGRFFSPGTTKEIAKQAQNYASMEYDKHLDRWYAEKASRLQPLQSLAGVGQTTAGQMGQIGARMGGVGANILAQSSAPYAYAGQMGQTNALMAGISGLTNVGANVAQQYYGQTSESPFRTNYAAQQTAQRKGWQLGPRQ